MPKGRHDNHRRSVDHPRWSERRIVSEHGYVKLRVGKGHPLADPNGYAYEHAVVWAAAGLSAPYPDEVHHHKNEVKTDNRIENLEIRSRVDHSVGHQPAALPDHEIVAMREDCDAGDHIGILAKRYGVPQQRVWKIVTGRTRRSAGGPIQGPFLRKRGRTWDEMPEVRRG